MLNLRPARCFPIDGSLMVENWSGFASQSVSVSHINRRREKLINLWIFFQPVFTGAGQGGESVQKSPAGWLISFSLPSFDISVARGESGDVGLSEKDSSRVCLFYALSCVSLLIGLYGPALIRHEYVIIYIFNLPLVNFNFSKVKHGDCQRNINNMADCASQLDNWGQRGKSFSLHWAG